MKDEATWSRENRDLLIKVDTKLDSLTVKVNELSDGTTTRLTKVETRLDQMDVYHAGIDMKYYKDIAEWAYGFRAKLTVFVFIGSTLIIVLNAIVISVLQKWLGI